jgi:hypothetical protein
LLFLTLRNKERDTLKIACQEGQEIIKKYLKRTFVESCNRAVYKIKNISYLPLIIKRVNRYNVKTVFFFVVQEGIYIVDNRCVNNPFTALFTQSKSEIRLAFRAQNLEIWSSVAHVRAIYFNIH